MKIAIPRLGRILLVAIQQDLSDDEALAFQSNLLSTIAEIEALGVVVDISALDVVDSFMARVINDTASMARLLGAEVIVCGIQPFVAFTLVEMGRGLLSADCTFNLEQGLKTLQSRIASRGDYSLLSEDDDLVI
ncbi:STAS domain-containing protein [Actimicrobium sp. CCI2.3]|uniref:STAS domain-containing protein n=1 Tax=Actimicrobium sp. CCI2.3 TaxID=3048616 RepID=UPI002AB48139|nr:STAS domain-containing protein [Actimicrobium sp. CCI2.3]MDY7574819.1 STAS domain-containing protein [Actimicrobium sp. CCI2.3]MEB0020220.1 STAS domain-containing protein [Actimicrobium sp. CCI2.3]